MSSFTRFLIILCIYQVYLDLYFHSYFQKDENYEDINKKKSRKENLAAIRQLTSSMPDAAKLPGSDAPAWMQDDDHDIM